MEHRMRKWTWMCLLALAGVLAGEAKAQYQDQDQRRIEERQKKMMEEVQQKQREMENRLIDLEVRQRYPQPPDRDWLGREQGRRW
jgi:hypothetical protein